jgi:hypothetical protein
MQDYCVLVAVSSLLNLHIIYYAYSHITCLLKSVSHPILLHLYTIYDIWKRSHMQRYIIRSDLKPRKMWIKIRDEHYRIWSVSITELCSEWLERQLLCLQLRLIWLSEMDGSQKEGTSPLDAKTAMQLHIQILHVARTNNRAQMVPESEVCICIHKFQKKRTQRFNLTARDC